MAIQERRGNYSDLDTSRLVQGEPFVTLDKVDGDYYAGIAIGPSNVIRFATWDNLVDIRTDCEQARDDAQASAENAATSEENAAESEENAGQYWDYVHDAVDLVIPSVSIDFTTGQLMYSGSQLLFWIDTSTGNLMWSVTGA